MLVGCYTPKKSTWFGDVFSFPRGHFLWDTIPETNELHLKIDGWNTSFILGWAYFQGIWSVLVMMFSQVILVLVVIF